MARQNKKLTHRSRAVKASREMLIEGAASMSGSISKGLTKSVANSLISGAVGQDAFDKRKMKRKIKKKLKYRGSNIEVGPVMSGPEQITGLPPNKKSTNKMKKQSAFKMKGFSGFKNESPVKQTIKYGEKSYTKKDPKKSYMGDKSRSNFGLYDAGMKAKWHEYGFPGAKYSKKDVEAAGNAEIMTTGGLAGTMGLALTGGGGTLGAGLTGAGIVLGEGTRRMRKGQTRAKDRPASKFSGGKTWSQAKQEGKNKFKLKSGKNK